MRGLSETDEASLASQVTHRSANQRGDKGCSQVNPDTREKILGIGFSLQLRQPSLEPKVSYDVCHDKQESATTHTPNKVRSLIREIGLLALLFLLLHHLSSVTVDKDKTEVACANGCATEGGEVDDNC